ncbi:carbohydrate ABC transporter permease [Streptomyces sp. NPDC050560]|uniref:carbohydrate ABC transporter permease n=1 Tax=Streptomyces sp. NPDC050560 TaxID=3365630 RepID=UPI0037A2E8C5
MTASAWNVRWRGSRAVERTLLHVCVVAVVLVVALPLLWMTLCSLKSTRELVGSPPTVLPAQWTMDNYRSLFTTTTFGTFFVNSALVAVGTTVISVVIGSLAAYSITRFRYRATSLFAKGMLLAYMTPSVLMATPLLIVLLKLGLVDSRIGLIVADTTFTLPVSVWLMRSYFRAIPVELEEAAMVDGCGRLRALIRVTFPLAMPGAVSVALFVFAHAWNEFLFALIFIASAGKKTLPVGMEELLTQNQVEYWGVLLAGGVLITLPVIVLYAALQRKIVAGLGAGGLKA